MTSYKDRIHRQVRALIQLIADAAQQNRTLLANEIMYWYTFDGMGEFAFNQSFGMMEHKRFHFTYSLFRNALGLLGPLTSVIWLLKIAFVWFKWVPPVRGWFEMMDFCMKQMDTRQQVRAASDTNGVS